MIKSHQINKSKNFISGYYLKNLNVCDEIIETFELNPDAHISGTVGKNQVQPDKKLSTDMPVGGYMGMLPYTNYFPQLCDILEEYKKDYPYSDKHHAHYGMWPRVNVQKYKPGEGFYDWHFEKNGLNNMHRHLVFMTYLNDVTDGGGTEFYHQGVTVQAEKGLTLIWPAEWPWTHRGITSPTQTKYIITGWYSYYG